MTQSSSQNFDFAALLPGVGVFGGVRRFIEIGNELIRRGHRYVLYHPKGNHPDWLPFLGEVRPTRALAQAYHQVLICNDPPSLDVFDSARADLKFFYFALENMKGERMIARHPGWTILANSTGMHDWLRRRYRIHVEKVIGGINLDVFKPHPASDADRDHYRVLAFGRLSRKKKGVPIILRAAEALARSVARRRRSAQTQKPVKLVLFDSLGPGNERDPRSDIRCSVPYEFHINLSQAELARLYSTCDVFVSAERRAGWANTVAEAMACGVPVVCTRSGARDTAVHRETAWIARWRHHFFLSRGLLTLHDDPTLSQHLCDNALERIRGFSWPRVVDQLEAVVIRKLGSAR